jgi:hypothetical protein
MQLVLNHQVRWQQWLAERRAADCYHTVCETVFRVCWGGEGALANQGCLRTRPFPAAFAVLTGRDWRKVDCIATLL